MAKYMFTLEQLAVDFQRGKQPDVYMATFGIEVGARAIGPIGRFLNEAVPNQQGKLGIVSGDIISLADFPPDNPAGKWGTWDIGVVEVGTGDTVAVDYAFINTSDNGQSLSRGDQVKIELTAFTSIVSLGLAATGVGAVAAAIVAGVGAVLSEIVGDIIPSDPKCNGVAFADKVILSGTEITSGTNVVGGVMVIDRPSGNPNIPSDCGHPSAGSVIFQVTAVPVESVKRFLGPKGDLSQGIKRALNLTAPTISVRSLIEV